MSLSIYKQQSGANMVIGFEGTQDEIERAFNGFYNHNGFPKAAEPVYINDKKTFAVAQTSWERFKKALINKYVTGLLSKKRQRSWQSINIIAEIKAERYMEQIRHARIAGLVGLFN